MKCALRNKDKKRIWEKKNNFEAIRPVDKEKDRQTDRQTDRHTDTQTSRTFQEKLKEPFLKTHLQVLGSVDEKFQPFSSCGDLIDILDHDALQLVYLSLDLRHFGAVVVASGAEIGVRRRRQLGEISHLRHQSR